MRLLLVAAICFLALAPAARADSTPPIIANSARMLPVLARGGMVVAQEENAARAGLEILRRGGNAIDAAVATGFALAVTLPRAGNLGGGGFMVVHLKDGRNRALDYRETAPAAASRDMFLDAAGAADPQKSRNSALAVATPGSVAGLVYAHEHWGSGRFTLADLVAPAIALARDGVVVADDLGESLAQAARLGRFDSSRRIFFRDGAPLRDGERLVQSDLAATLQRIAQNGARGFYEGETARAIAQSVAAAGGVLTADDLKNYRPIERAALIGTYRGRTIVSMPPPSSGGVHLIELLNVMERFPVAQMGQGGVATTHMMTEAMKLAFADRAEWLGDPDFVSVPVAGLVSKGYAAKLAAEITDTARPSRDIKRIDPAPFEGDQTTHFSIVDRDGVAVANTTTLNFSYGLGLVATGTGVLLNNEMDDFSAKPGAPNGFGLVGGLANAVAPNKRPLSSMTPTIVLRDGHVEIVTGSPGGPRIITTVVEMISNMVDHGLNAAEATAAPRFHHQWMPDELRVERGMPIDTLALLRARGHNVIEREAMGSTATIQIEDGLMMGAADTRQRGTAAVGLP
ncbi:MAG: gamma-glutamyltransferase [Hyphomicrobiales bacterium]|nr:gamma-glutamyltransferase [Hyphomicrobiales bacterium]